MVDFLTFLYKYFYSLHYFRALLRILDQLDSSYEANIKLLSENFLTHALLRSDLPRILDPLLTLLLSPNTARVSIRHVNIKDADSKSLCDIQDICKVDESTDKKVRGYYML